MAGDPTKGPASAAASSVAPIRGDFSALYRSLSSLASALQGTLDVLRDVHQAPASGSAALIDVVNELLVAKASKGVRHRYLVQLRLTMLDLVRHIGGSTPARDVTPAHLEAWLMRPEWGAHARRSYLIDARTLFAFALRREYSKSNPALAVEMPRRDDAPPGIHTPDQVRKVLEAARSLDLDVCRLLAVQYFAGLRPAEAARISDADIAGGFVRVAGAHSKTRQRRLVTVHPALQAWLVLGGSLPVTNRVRRYYRVRKVAGVPWSHDVTRHSFVSYHLAHWRSASVTAMEAGHSESILFRHYREVVTPDQAAEFWAIRPVIQV
jgi:hypothetical protein